MNYWINIICGKEKEDVLKKFHLQQKSKCNQNSAPLGTKFNMIIMMMTKMSNTVFAI